VSKRFLNEETNIDEEFLGTVMMVQQDGTLHVRHPSASTTPLPLSVFSTPPANIHRLTLKKSIAVSY
jgi:hypothetical protein